MNIYSLKASWAVSHVKMSLEEGWRKRFAFLGIKVSYGDLRRVFVSLQGYGKLNKADFSHLGTLLQTAHAQTGLLPSENQTARIAGKQCFPPSDSVTSPLSVYGFWLINE